MSPDTLTPAQLRVLRKVLANPAATFNGRIRRTAEALAAAGLIESRWEPLQCGLTGRFMREVWFLTLTAEGTRTAQALKENTP